MLGIFARTSCTGLLREVGALPSGLVRQASHARFLASLPPSTPSDQSPPKSSVIRPSWNQQAPTKPHTTTWGVMQNSDIQSSTAPPKSVEEIWREREISWVQNLPRPHNAYTGRSVFISKPSDIGIAFQRLRKILRSNRVLQGIRLTERHEKKGNKRRRLKSERWRRRFAHEVRQKVKLVKEIRARGA